MHKREVPAGATLPYLPRGQAVHTAGLVAPLTMPYMPTAHPGQLLAPPVSAL